MPQTLEEAVRIAVTVNNAERLKTPDNKKVFSTRRDSTTQGVTCYNCGKRATSLGTVGRLEKKTQPLGIIAHTVRNSFNNTNGQQVRCFHCKKIEHRRHQCPQLKGNNSAPNSPNQQGSATRSLRPTPGYRRASGNEMLLEVQEEGKIH